MYKIIAFFPSGVESLFLGSNALEKKRNECKEVSLKEWANGSKRWAKNRANNGSSSEGKRTNKIRQIRPNLHERDMLDHHKLK
ncbi:hypothetical protein L1887_34345 [Cichorium endivia]|nr:hypothetical protein L1887_34345 [Cichorium endivia]